MKSIEDRAREHVEKCAEKILDVSEGKGHDYFWKRAWVACQFPNGVTYRLGATATSGPEEGRKQVVNFQNCGDMGIVRVIFDDDTFMYTGNGILFTGTQLP